MQIDLARSKKRLLEILSFIGFIWIIFFIDQFLPLEQYGVYPRRINGLTGVFAMPFLHANLSHLINNTIPLVVLLIVLSSVKTRFWSTVIGISIVTGLLLWLFGRTSLHIGASGLVFGLIGYLLAFGFKQKSFSAIVATVLVYTLYGGTIISGLSPLQSHVSWEGHLLGLITGVLIAISTRDLIVDK